MGGNLVRQFRQQILHKNAHFINKMQVQGHPIRRNVQVAAEVIDDHEELRKGRIRRKQ